MTAMGKRHFRIIYVISDLHIGGEYGTTGRGFRLCTRVQAIVDFIDQLIAQIADVGPSELVINGDMLDFLAEEDDVTERWSSFSSVPMEALNKFAKIRKRDHSFFEALRRLLDAGAKLTVLLGNHDLELSLPEVRSSFEEAIGLKAGHNYSFIYDNEAYVVGDVLIEHGNRYDAWNQVDHDGLPPLAVNSQTSQCGNTGSSAKDIGVQTAVGA